MPDKSAEEVIETDEAMELISSPVNSPHKKIKEDENQVESFNHYLFITLIVAFAIGSGHSMNFGASLFHHGSIVFFQFFTALLLIGYPLLLLETGLAQFSSIGAFLQFRRAIPLFGGIVSSMAFVLILNLTIQAVSLTNMGFLAGHTLRGMTDDLPWIDCTSKDCFNHRLKCPLDGSNLTQCTQFYSALVESRTSNERKTPFISFVETNILQNVLFMDDLKTFNHFLIWIYYFIFWILVGHSLPCYFVQIAFSAYWMEKWINYLALFVVSLSFLYYFVQLIIAACQEGSIEGLRFLWTPKWTTFFSGEAWTAAFLHAILALNLANGGIAFLSKKRPFHEGFRRYGALFTGLIALFYVLVNLTTFLYAGHLAKLTFSDNFSHKSIKFLLENRLNFLHFVYIESISDFKFSWLWSFVHFLVEIFRSYIFIIIIIWTLIDMYREKKTSFLGQKALSRRERILLIALLTGSSMIVSVPFLFPGGTIYLQNFEYFTDIATASIAFWQIIAFGIFYGVDRLSVNFETMAESWKFIKHFYSTCWSIITPAALLSTILMAIISAVITARPVHFVISTVGWTIVILVWIFPNFYAAVRILENKRGNEKNLKPEPEWGPLSEENRKESVRKERAARVR